MAMSNENSAKLQGWLSIVCNIALFVYKMIVGVLCGSVAVMADAWHSLSDCISSIVLLVGVKVAAKPADHDHPFGHGRAELIAALVIGVMLGGIAFEFIVNSIKRLLNPSPIEHSTMAVVAMIVTIVVKELAAQYAFYLGRRTGMNSLKADGQHHRSDAVSSLIILVGILFGGTWKYTDGILGIIVSGIIAFASYEIIRDVANLLLGVTPDRELLRKIRHVCTRVSGRKMAIHHVHLHAYGTHEELTFHVRLPGDMPLSDCHRIVSAIECELHKELHLTATCHVEPLENRPFLPIAQQNKETSEK